jgi:hypothetical protein
VIAASAVVFVRYAEKDRAPMMVERIAPRGVSTAEQVRSGILLQVYAKGLTLALPGCDAKEYQDKFFLHLYTEESLKKSVDNYINMDFDLTQEKGREINMDGSKICLFDKPFPNLAIKQISIGQFTTPQGRCCDITWSRSLLLDASLPKK